MSTMRYDIEFALSDAVKAYLESVLDNGVGGVMETSPVVTYYDPMAQDENERVIVLVERAETMAESPGNYTADVAITQKSRWKQPTMADDMAAHAVRSNEVRDKMMSPTLKADIDAQCEGFNVDFVSPVRVLSSDFREGWVYSEIRVTIKAHVAS